MHGPIHHRVAVSNSEVTGVERINDKRSTMPETLAQASLHIGVTMVGLTGRSGRQDTRGAVDKEHASAAD